MLLDFLSGNLTTAIPHARDSMTRVYVFAWSAKR